MAKTLCIQYDREKQISRVALDGQDIAGVRGYQLTQDSSSAAGVKLEITVSDAIEVQLQ